MVANFLVEIPRALGVESRDAGEGQPQQDVMTLCLPSKVAIFFSGELISREQL